MTEKKSRYRVALIGVGRQGMHHARAYALNPRCEVVAGADTDPENLELFCRRFQVPGYGSYEEMFAREQIDIAAPVLPVRANTDAVLAAARAGVSAISCEKPLCGSLEEADRMVEECRSRGILFAAGLVAKNRPQFWQAREMIEAGELGEVRSINVYDGNGQGGCHGINLARHFAGNPAVQFVVGQVEGDPFSDYEEGYAEGEKGFGGIGGYIRFANGVECHSQPATSWRGIEVVGSRGILFNDSASSPELHLWKAQGGAEPKGLGDLAEVEGVFPGPQERYNPDGSRCRDAEGWIVPTEGMIASVRAIVEVLDLGVEPRLTTGEDLRQALEICIALRESHRRGHAPVELPLADRSLSMFPVRTRWNYKKEVYGEAWYREQMSDHIKS